MQERVVHANQLGSNHVFITASEAATQANLTTRDAVKSPWSRFPRKRLTLIKKPGFEKSASG
jgi:hypothetical protein